jgi:phosphate transport system substrate-binding protein
VVGRDSVTPALKRTKRQVSHSVQVSLFALLVVFVNVTGAVFLEGNASAAGTQIDGIGSATASQLINLWILSTSLAPYDLDVSEEVANSGFDRFEFTNQMTDWAVTDIGYVGNTDATPPSFPFDYVPIVGQGVAFYYDIPGLTQQLQLTSDTACAVLTGGITNWDDPALAATNPGVTLPNLPIVPVTENDSAGTNLATEQWCISEQPTLWAAFVSSQESQPGGPTDGVALSPMVAYPNWPGIKGGIDEQSASTLAMDVANTAGAIGMTYVDNGKTVGDVVPNADGETTGNTPAKAVALVENASGDFTAPTPLDVTSALAYATPLDSGLQNLNFNGLGPNVYNPSTFSYLLIPTSGWSSAKGETMSAFVNYALTLGQQIAPEFGYASLGQPLERFGINEVADDAPGAVPMTAAEQSFYTCGDLTPSDAAAGNTASACESSPGDGLPETPYAVALPIVALAAFGAVFTLRRRKILSTTS